MCSILRGLDVVIPQEEIVLGLPLWMLPIPRVCYTPTSKTASHHSAEAADTGDYSISPGVSSPVHGRVAAVRLEGGECGVFPRHKTLHWEDGAMVDSLAKTACDLLAADLSPLPSLSCCLKKVHVAALLETSRRRDHQRPASVSIHHYHAFRHHRYKYCV
ncbi:hypothetical protein E2C01_065621 [Portunus trituberculatus]|uniref:Uncharacterized protein n=1 Tax=Portunus trituberculatus TaxID=210409 RepID=A0A5B7HS94_PORTR|nr:hypothetical protein [Portunus trituberculatus]